MLAGGALDFSINGSTNYGSIHLANNIALAGALGVSLANDYSPTSGDSFALLSYGSETGTFSTLDLPHLSGGLIWRTNYGATSFTLMVTSAPPFQLTAGTIGNAGGDFLFNFEAIAGQSYQVQYTTNLAPAHWIDLGDPITATNSSMTVSDLTGLGPHRFYRVILQ